MSLFTCTTVCGANPAEIRIADVTSWKVAESGAASTRANTVLTQRAPAANGWENGTIGAYLDATIGAYLDAAVRWGDRSIDELRLYEKPSNPWKRAAEILHMEALYE